MGKHVNSNQSVIEFPLVISHTIEYTLAQAISPCLLSKFDI
jgi:hypothetical protein